MLGCNCARADGLSSITGVLGRGSDGAVAALPQRLPMGVYERSGSDQVEF